MVQLEVLFLAGRLLFVFLLLFSEDGSGLDCCSDYQVLEWP